MKKTQSLPPFILEQKPFTPNLSPNPNQNLTQAHTQTLNLTQTHTHTPMMVELGLWLWYFQVGNKFTSTALVFKNLNGIC